MIPLARTNNLLITQVGEEVIVYDRERDTAHCLNAMAARVWHYFDGQNTVEDIAKLLEEDLELSADEDVDWRGLVWLTLEELQRFYLIQEYLSQPISPVVQSAGESRVSRRKMIKTATLVGGFAIGSMFPLVKSIVAPAPGMAAPPSPTPTPTPSPCPKPIRVSWTARPRKCYSVMMTECLNHCEACKSNLTDIGYKKESEYCNGTCICTSGKNATIPCSEREQIGVSSLASTSRQCRTNMMTECQNHCRPCKSELGDIKYDEESEYCNGICQCKS
jgi:hypothetical protein